ncbi:hypothetical protein GGU10DRAFT_106825 [Lentinula aff. detonsa]|uniref:Uncharacterized protein n=1 Tax=Lentinula aff. detonsa TaxID=2804958 RepID=A0AA38NJH7_9AGAR|nr:hypothetical protein GGU10DRAFT_106825 [Lentinula aff. detonsa]
MTFFQSLDNRIHSSDSGPRPKTHLSGITHLSDSPIPPFIRFFDSSGNSSWAAYNMYSACTACQGLDSSILTWVEFRANCGSSLSNTTCVLCCLTQKFSFS